MTQIPKEIRSLAHNIENLGASTCKWRNNMEYLCCEISFSNKKK